MTSWVSLHFGIYWANLVVLGIGQGGHCPLWLVSYHKCNRSRKWSEIFIMFCVGMREDARDLESMIRVAPDFLSHFFWGSCACPVIRFGGTRRTQIKNSEKKSQLQEMRGSLERKKSLGWWSGGHIKDIL